MSAAASSSPSHNELTLVVKEWMALDAEIRRQTRELKNVREKKTDATRRLVEAMKSQSIDCLNLGERALVYKQRTSKRAITAKSLVKNLTDYFEDSATADDVAQYLLNNRAEVTVEEIQRRGPKET
jgi:hypothetical protein